jgi:N-acetylglucosaminyl-diphospho-decaprenol L-rhamnosyltransferase
MARSSTASSSPGNERRMPPEVSVVVPTVGRSPWLVPCLESIRRQQGIGAVEILVVDQAPRPVELPPGLADRVLRPERNLGFAGGTNLGLAAATGQLLATVNDDALIEPGWLAALVAALGSDPRAAAAQGVNLLLGDPATGVDGCGLGWNRWWQAVQLGHGESAAGDATGWGRSRSWVNPPGSATPASSEPGPPDGPPEWPATAEVFGVSATAALFRRSALERVAPGGQVFDPRLISYYEDAELAGRLRGAGFRALVVPAARAHHAGSASGRAASRERWHLIYSNRYLAAAGLLGRAFWLRLPAMLCRDLLDLLALVRPGGGDARARRERLAGMATGWWRALRRLPGFARRGAPAVHPAEVARLSRLPGEPG